MVDTKLHDEPGRLAALKRAEILDTAPEEPFDRITGLVRTVLNVPLATVSLIDENRQWLKSCVGLDITSTPRDVAFCHYTIQGREPMYIPDAKLDPRFADNPLVTGAPYIGSYLGIPLSSPDGYNVGSLCAIDFKPRTFDAAQIQVLKSFAALVTDEMELRRIAAIDHLTGALTRRGFCLEAAKAISRFERHRRSSALLMFDIDHFKKVNDTHGHPAGDEVLRSVGKEMSRLLRTSDVLGRLGGEEFGILLADAEPEDAYRSAERFRIALEALTIKHKPPIKVTASFGIGMVEAGGGSPEEWMARTDQALYTAKRTGRNKSCFAPVDTGTEIGS